MSRGGGTWDDDNLSWLFLERELVGGGEEESSGGRIHSPLSVSSERVEETLVRACETGVAVLDATAGGGVGEAGGREEKEKNRWRPFIENLREVDRAVLATGGGLGVSGAGSDRANAERHLVRGTPSVPIDSSAAGSTVNDSSLGEIVVGAESFDGVLKRFDRFTLLRLAS